MHLEIHQRLLAPEQPQMTLTLPFDLRQKSRLRTRLDDGQEVGLFLPRGTVLRSGDLLLANNGLIVEIRAAIEEVSTATDHGKNPWLLARACYHLGNRHVALQIGPGWLRYLRDHVLDHLVEALGLMVSREQTPFEPEAGAYLGDHGH